MTDSPRWNIPGRCEEIFCHSAAHAGLPERIAVRLCGGELEEQAAESAGA